MKYRKETRPPSLYIIAKPAMTAPTTPNPPTAILSPADVPLALALPLAEVELELFVPFAEVELDVVVEADSLPLLTLAVVGDGPPERSVTLGVVVIVLPPLETSEADVEGVAPLVDSVVEVAVTIPLRSL